MIDEGEPVIVDWVKRSDEEQHKLWKIGRDNDGNKIGTTVTDCDGTIEISKHQPGMATDLYFVVAGTLTPPIKGYKYWHDKWEETGGSPAIEWDKGHFE